MDFTTYTAAELAVIVRDAAAAYERGQGVPAHDQRKRMVPVCVPAGLGEGRMTDNRTVLEGPPSGLE